MTSIFYLIIKTSAVTSASTPVWNARITPIYFHILHEDTGDEFSTFCTIPFRLHELSTKIHGITQEDVDNATHTHLTARTAIEKFIADHSSGQRVIVVTPMAQYSQAVFPCYGKWEWFCTVTACREKFIADLEEKSPLTEPFSILKMFERKFTADEQNSTLKESNDEDLSMMKAIFTKLLVDETTEFDSGNPGMFYLYQHPDELRRTKKTTLMAKLVGDARNRSIYEKMHSLRAEFETIPGQFGFTVGHFMQLIGFLNIKENTVIDLDDEYKQLCARAERYLRTEVTTNTKKPKPNNLFSDVQIANVIAAICDLDPIETVQLGYMYNLRGTPEGYLPIRVTKAQALILDELGYRSGHELVLAISYEDGVEKYNKALEIDAKMGVNEWYFKNVEPLLPEIEKALIVA